MDILTRLGRRPTITAVPELGGYLPLLEAAKEYQVSPDTLFRLLRAGKLTRLKRASDRRNWLSVAELNEYFRPRPAEED